jgi:beta-phosphoglucomutase-like phosphatase (HAD superfamily)
VNILDLFLLPANRTILYEILDNQRKIMSALTDLQAAVAAENTVIASAITLLNGLKAQLDAAIASGDPAALTALSADIAGQTAALAAAVTANTPAA